VLALHTAREALNWHLAVSSEIIDIIAHKKDCQNNRWSYPSARPVGDWLPARSRRVFGSARIQEFGKST